MSFEEIVQNIIFFGIVSGLITWLIRSLFTQYLKRDIQQYKHKLVEEQIRFSKLHEKRADVIQNLYSRLVDFEGKMASFVNPFQPAGALPIQKKKEDAGKAGDEFVKYSSINKIYFSKELCEIIEDINKQFKRAWIDFTTFTVYEKSNRVLTSEEKHRNWIKAWDTVSKEIPKLREKLESEFREILGVN